MKCVGTVGQKTSHCIQPILNLISCLSFEISSSFPNWGFSLFHFHKNHCDIKTPFIMIAVIREMKIKSFQNYFLTLLNQELQSFWLSREERRMKEELQMNSQ